MNCEGGVRGVFNTNGVSLPILEKEREGVRRAYFVL